MPIKYFIFKFPGLSQASCAFQFPDAASPASLAGNISYLVGDDEKIVLENRLGLLKELPDMSAWSECRQVHGVNILHDPAPTSPDAKTLPEADGMMTDKRGLGLLIKTADCQPVLLCDNKGEHIMALHVGWRGNRNDFISKAVGAFCETYGLEPKNLFAVRGPSLGPASAEFVNYDTEWGSGFDRWYDKKTKCMNLWKLTAFQLKSAGLQEDNIYALDICTYENSPLFFSYRRSHRSGRQGSLIWLHKLENVEK